MKNYVHLWEYLAEISLVREMFHTKVVEKLKTHTLCSITPPPPPKNSPFSKRGKNFKNGGGGNKKRNGRGL